MIPCYNTALNSYRKWKIGNDLRAILVQDSGVTSYVGQNIFPLIAPENTIGDFIIYGREKYTKRLVKMGVYEDECLVFVTIITENYDKAIALADAVDLALVGEHTLNDNTKITIDLDDSTETFSDDKYIETLLFKII